MSQSLGRGFFGSLRADVRHDVRRLLRSNTTFIGARYSFIRRILLRRIANRSFKTTIGLYLALLMLAVLVEWQMAVHGVRFRPGYYGDGLKSDLKDIASYLISAQVGILAVVSVAVSVVTLLSQRDDGASANTDVRLYYVESYSYELAVSGVAFLFVLTVQLFWPLQHILHAAGLGTTELTLKIGLTFGHCLWFCFNLFLFLQFITTTLRFVEPESREVLRERYSASDVIPRDIEHRLLRANYLMAPEQLFGQQALAEGPIVTFGHGFATSEDGVSEIRSPFRRSVRLRDIWLRPLRIALRNWRRRAQRAGKSATRPSRWDSQIAILANFDRTEDGPRDWVLRTGNTPLLAWERILIRWSFRFASAETQDAAFPTPTNFIEQLINKVVDQINKSAQTSFESSLSEVIRYHAFVLAAQNVRGDDGQPINLAEVGGFVSRPDADWIREYRRVYVAAAEKITSETFFMQRLGNVATRLLPNDPTNFSPRVIQTLLELGLHEVVVLEAWLTRRALIATTDLDAAPGLAGSDKRAYESVLINFVGSWETLQRAIFASFETPRGTRSAQVDRWTTLAQVWPVLQTHLSHASYFLAAAVWNDDEIGADRYRDLLLRWLHPFYGELREEYRFSSPELLTPDVMTATWPEAEAAAKRLLRFDHDPLSPNSLFGVMLREVHNDVLILCAATFLSWYVNRRQPAETVVRTARHVLRREKLGAEGTDLTANPSSPPKSIFRMAFDLILRYALRARFGDVNYSASVNGLLNSLNGMATPRMIPGRIYSGYGVDGFEALRPQVLAILSAHMPPTGNDGVVDLLQHLLDDGVLFESDEPFRRLIWSFREYLNALNAMDSEHEFAQTIAALGTEFDAEVCLARAKTLFSDSIALLEAQRLKRLRLAPLDDKKLAAMRQAITETILTNGPDITVFRNIEITRDAEASTPIQEEVFGEIDRGAFTMPVMSDLDFNQLAEMVADLSRQYLARFIWQEFLTKAKRSVTVDVSCGVMPLWEVVIADAPEVGPEPFLLVPYEGVGEQVSMRSYGLGGLDALLVTREDDVPSGGGTGYLGTLEGIRVYHSNLGADKVVLCSGLLLRKLRYGSPTDSGFLADFDFLDGDNPEKNQVRLRFAQATVWSADVFVEYTLIRSAASNSDVTS